MQNGELKTLKLHQVESFLSSTVLTASQVKNGYHCALFVYLSGGILLCSFFQMRGFLREVFLSPGHDRVVTISTDKIRTYSIKTDKIRTDKICTAK